MFYTSKQIDELEKIRVEMSQLVLDNVTNHLDEWKWNNAGESASIVRNNIHVEIEEMRHGQSPACTVRINGETPCRFIFQGSNVDKIIQAIDKIQQRDSIQGLMKIRDILIQELK